MNPIKHNPRLQPPFRLFSLLLSLSLLLIGCQNQIVEKIGVLPDRSTELISIDAEENQNPTGKSWIVQGASELSLSSVDTLISASPSAHYYQNNTYLYQVSQSDDSLYEHSFHRITDDGELLAQNTILLEADRCYFSPDGSKAAYEMTIDDVMMLYLYDFTTEKEQLIWQSESLSVLSDYDFSLKVHLLCQWSSDGSTLLFMPLCYQNRHFADNFSSDYLITDIICSELPSFPFVYVYQIEPENLQSYFIAAEDYTLYPKDTAPKICSNADGSRFFVYFNSPSAPALAHYIDVNNGIHYKITLTDYLPNFTWLGSDPIFYNQLLYLHVNGIGIMVLDLEQGKLLELYSFNDPIQSFTIYENTLIVAQPSASSVDVTAYLLNLEDRQSVLLYHSDSFEYSITHMEMSQDGLHLLLEQLSSAADAQKKLIQLSFASTP